MHPPMRPNTKIRSIRLTRQEAKRVNLLDGSLHTYPPNANSHTYPTQPVTLNPLLGTSFNKTLIFNIILGDKPCTFLLTNNLEYTTRSNPFLKITTLQKSLTHFANKPVHPTQNNPLTKIKVFQQSQCHLPGFPIKLATKPIQW